MAPQPTHKVTPGCQFASDNTAGICPEAWAALRAANEGNVPSYGDDDWTQRACDLIRSVFRHPEAEVFFVFNGTAANSLALAALSQSYHGVICHEHAHVATDECGAPEFFSNGTKLLTAPGSHGKLTAAAIEELATRRTDVHFPKPRAVTLSQSTELGSLYSQAEIAAIGAVARTHGLAVHMDGARFANAAAALCHGGHLEPADLTWRAGVDVLCFGGTKNGAQTTEAVVFFNDKLAVEFEYRCKQAGQLASKMRFLSSQWIGLLESGAWLHHAAHANGMARELAGRLAAIPTVRLAQPVAANAVFVQMPAVVAAAMRTLGWIFYDFIAAGGYRLMCAWNTSVADIDFFIADLRSIVSAQPG